MDAADAMDFGTQADEAPPPSAAAEAAAAATASAHAAASTLGASLGLMDPSLDEGKRAGAAIATLTAGPASKRPKMNHHLFYEDERGLKKMLRTFPSIKVLGKGHEYQDLSLLLRHYKKWFEELHPYGDHFEDLVWKARQVLEDKEKEEDGVMSDPREKLHAFRFAYKSAKPEDGRSAPAAAGAQLSDEVRAKIEANRQRALEVKRKREAEKNGAGEGASAPAAAPQEVDMEELWQIEEERAEAARRDSASRGPAPDDEDEDPFGYGGGLDGDDDFGGGPPARAAQAANNAKPATQAPPPPAFDDEEEDPFGFGGGGFDDE